MRMALTFALLVLICASAVAIRPRPMAIVPAAPDPAVTAIEREVERLDAKIDKALEMLVDRPDEHVQAEAQLRRLQAELAEAKAHVAVARAAFARAHCPGGRVSATCP